jgi:hypothetical protein
VPAHARTSRVCLRGRARARELPPAAYLTIADKALIAAYLTIGLNLFLSVLMMRLMQKDRADAARLMRERSHRLVPGFAFVAYVIVALT